MLLLLLLQMLLKLSVFKTAKFSSFPSRSSVLCPEEEANSNSYTHRFSIKQRVVETKRITIVGQKNTGGLS